MRSYRVRFTMRWMMLAVALMAILMGLGIAARTRYFTSGMVRSYYVGDLLNPRDSAKQKAQELWRLSSDLQYSVTPDVWWARARMVRPFVPNASLIVRHSSDGHRQVVNWLRQQRVRRQNSPSRAASRSSERTVGVATPG
jgi:hypothetical protein